MRLNDPEKIHRVVSKQVRYQLRKKARQMAQSGEPRELVVALLKKARLMEMEACEAVK